MTAWRLGFTITLKNEQNYQQGQALDGGTDFTAIVIEMTANF